MRFEHLVVLVLSALVPAGSAAGAAQRSTQAMLSEARELSLAGAYEKALQLYEPLIGDGGSAAAAAAGAAEVLLQTGRYADALARLDKVSAGQKSDAWQVARAQVLLETGKYHEALAAAEQALKINPRNTTARRLAGQIHELLGAHEAAIKSHAWFEDLLRQGYPSSAVALTDAGICLYRKAVLQPGPQSVSRTRYVLQELFQPAAEQVDPRYWPARLASAQLLLSKYNLHEAAEDFKATLKVNPNLANPHIGLGEIALEEWKFEEVESQIAAALRVNPHSAAAHRLGARLHLTERKYAAAGESAQKALATNPNDLEALGLLAAVQTQMGDAAAAKGTLVRAAQVNPRCAMVPAELATWLAARRQYPEAEAAFRQAIALAPHWPQPQTELGLMYMQTGDEAAARKVLDSSWALDPYNVETKNTLDLLDRLERFGQHESEHFIVQSDEGVDAAVRPYLSAYMEEIYAQICRDYGIEPPEKTIVELFPSHDSFAVRITGKPWIHTIGACTGRVIALDAPRASAAGRPFNWARVLRHEFTHTVTLAATRNRIPHWLTEGLAVGEEFRGGAVRDWQWCRLLGAALRHRRLFDLDAIDWAFVRPRRAGDRTLAYAQSEWMVECLVQREGRAVIGRLLKAFEAGKPQSAVFAEVVGISPDQFYKHFLGWAAGQVASWGLPAQQLPGAPELLLRIAGSSEAARPDLLVQLSESYLDSGYLDRAEEAARQALQFHSEHASAVHRMMEVTLARVAEARKEQKPELRKKVVEHATLLAKLRPADPDAARVLASAAIEAGRKQEAVSRLEVVKKACPLDSEPYRRLMEIYLGEGDSRRALPELIELARLEDDEVDLPLKIAELKMAAGHPAEAIEWLRRAVRIDPYSIEIHDRLGRLLMESERFAEAVREFEVLTRLEPQSAKHQGDLAFALHRTGRLAPAREAARRAVELDGNSPARSLLAR